MFALKKFSLYVSLYIFICSGNLWGGAISLQNIEKEISDLNKNRNPNNFIFVPENQKKIDEACDKIISGINQTIVNSIKGKDFKTVDQFMNSTKTFIQYHATRATINFLIEKNIDYEKEKLFCFDGIVKNFCPYKNFILLKVCSLAPQYRPLLQKSLKAMILAGKASPFLLEFDKSLYSDHDIMAFIKKQKELVTATLIGTLERDINRRVADKEEYFPLFYILLAARNKNNDMFEYFHEHIISMPFTPGYKLLVGYAIIGTNESYKCLLHYQADFTKYKYSGLPAAFTVAGILSHTIENYPLVQERWVAGFTPDQAKPYLDWNKKYMENNSYTIKKLSPYDLYSFFM
ncbi:MAG: hypothetical protein PHQ27_00475 [Victivallales bacterium]|nr:hypothetical protein [Victivallales bacterium]